MKAKCEIVFDLETGDYDVRFHNLSEPGKPMDYLRLRPALQRVLQDFDEHRMEEEAADAAVEEETPAPPRRRKK